MIKYLIFTLLISFICTSVSLYSQNIYGEFIGFNDTLFIKTNNKVELMSYEKNYGILKDSLIIFETDTLILRRYNQTNYFYLLPLNQVNTCNLTLDSYYLKKEYWKNGNIKEERKIKYLPRKGYLQHGETFHYNEDGSLKQILKFRNGKKL